MHTAHTIFLKSLKNLKSLRAKAKRQAPNQKKHEHRGSAKDSEIVLLEKKGDIFDGRHMGLKEYLEK